MSGDWLKMRKDLDDDGRVWHIADALGVPREHAIGLLRRVWNVADSLSVNGVLANYTDAMIDKLPSVPVPGLARAMRAVGWLEDAPDGGLRIPKFRKYMGKSAKKRAKDRERQRRKRERDRHAPVTRDTSGRKCDSHASREEKRREEKRREEKAEEATAAAQRQDAVLTAAEAWAGGDLLSTERDPLVRLLVDLEEQPAADIAGNLTSPADLVLPAIDEARRTGKPFKSGGAAAKFLLTVVRDCVRRGRPPGDFGEAVTNGKPKPAGYTREELERLAGGAA